MPDRREGIIGLVMAGGAGTRMARSRPHDPKPLVRVGGIPLLELVLRQMLRADLRDIRLALRHEALRIRDWALRQPFLPAGRVRCLIEDEPLGTIGALFALRSEHRPVLVMNGDLLSAVDLSELCRFHARQRSELTIATHVEFHRLKLGEVVTGANHRVIEYREKPVKEYRISSGIYLIEPTVLALLEKREWIGFPDLAQRAIASGRRVLEFFHQDTWIDVNDAEDLAAAEEILRRDPVAFGLDPSQVQHAE
jgi:NDP-sugar pyrophosphorylase family protein